MNTVSQLPSHASGMTLDENALKAAPYPQTYDSWTPAGRALDDMTVDQWLDANVPGVDREIEADGIVRLDPLARGDSRILAG